MKEDPWFCVWAIIFIISYCSVLAWPIVIIFIWEMEEKIQNWFENRKRRKNEY